MQRPLQLILPALVGLAALASSGLADAGALYRCVGADGVTAFTSSRTGYSQCKLVGNFASPPKAAQAAATPPVTPAPVEFRTAPGGGEPRAVSVPSGTRPTVSRGAVYKYEKDGVTHYTNRRPSGQRASVLFSYIETCFACSVVSSVDFNSVGLNLDAFRDEVIATAAANGVDPALVRAVIHAESAFNPNALSHVGAQGLMQLMPDTAARFGVTEAFIPAENIKGGVSYLAWLMKRFDGDTTRVAAAYNAGEGAVDRYGGVPPYAETQVFVERVGILHGRYRDALNPGATVAAAQPGASAN